LVDIKTFFKRDRNIVIDLLPEIEKNETHDLLPLLHNNPRDDIAALTPESSRVSCIPIVFDLDAEEVDKILG